MEESSKKEILRAPSQNQNVPLVVLTEADEKQGLGSTQYSKILFKNFEQVKSLYYEAVTFTVIFDEILNYKEYN